MNSSPVQHLTPWPDEVSLALVGSGGAGIMTAGALLLQAAGRAGRYGVMTRSVGPQIRGGEAAALLCLSGAGPVECMSDRCDLLLAIDWKNASRFAAEIPLGPASLVISDPQAGTIPAAIADSGARAVGLPLAELAAAIPGARANMIALGVLAALTALPVTAFEQGIRRLFGAKGEDAVTAACAALECGHETAAALLAPGSPATVEPGSLATAKPAAEPVRWLISGNQATGLGALRGGVRFAAAYPITPATEVLEWMAPNLPKVGGTLVQAEDELASINMAIGASFGGVPSLTATSGPGLALMTEGLGLAVGAEVPVVVVNVMRGGPSTGIPTKSEQADLDIAVYGLHGDAPHLVLAPQSVADCLFTTQWAVHLAEAVQAPAIVLSDQYLGQASAVIDPPADVSFFARRRTAAAPPADFARYAITADGVSPVPLPGTAGGQYTADGLEHAPSGAPSGRVEDHAAQLDKRRRKIDEFDYGDHWATVEGEGALAVITWGSTTGAVRAAIEVLRRDGIEVRLIAIRLLLPVQAAAFADAIAGVTRALVVEQSHSGQFYRYLRAHYELSGALRSLHRAGPLTLRPGEIVEALRAWEDA